MTEETVIVSDEVEIFSSFEKMKIPENVLRGIYGHGFTEPSFPQSKGIVPIIEGKDILMQAQSGTGKTGTFVIGSMSRIDPSLKEVQVLCLAPTRELADQIQTVAKEIGESSTVNRKQNICTYAALGKNPIKEDIRALGNKSVHFLVGTPGRIYDLLNRKYLSTKFF